MSIIDTFLKMEEEQDLFELQLSDGTFYWDIIRTELFMALNTSSCSHGVYPEAKYKLSIITIIKDFLKLILNELTLSYLIRSNPEYIFTTFQRQKKHNKFFDNITDHLYDLVSFSRAYTTFSYH